MTTAAPLHSVQNVPADLTFQLTSPFGAEIRVLMVCEDSAPELERIRRDSPMVVVNFWRTQVMVARWFDPEKECMVVLCMNRKNQVKAWNLVSLGTVGSTSCHPREIFRPAIVAASSAIIVMHNHPSGDAEPSRADFAVTEQLQRAALALDIPLLDHIVVGAEGNDNSPLGYFSFKEHYWNTLPSAHPASLKKSPARRARAKSGHQAFTSKSPAPARSEGQKDAAP
jgi:DNA repair protein RadC